MRGEDQEQALWLPLVGLAQGLVSILTVRGQISEVNYRAGELWTVISSCVMALSTCRVSLHGRRLEHFHIRLGLGTRLGLPL